MALVAEPREPTQRAAPARGALPRADEALPAGRAKREAVHAMFDRIAPRYDKMNRLMTAGLDQRWRRALLARVGVGPGDRLVDLACGTGDLAEMAVARGAKVVGLDIAVRMLEHAQRRGIRAGFVQADGARLPIAEGALTVATCGFALRNFVSLPEIFAELARVLAPGGRIAMIDVGRPRSPLLRAPYSLYFDRVVPLIGGWLSDRDAYHYLPRSTAYLPEAPVLRGWLEEAGFEAVELRPVMLGAAQVWTGIRSDAG